MCPSCLSGTARYGPALGIGALFLCTFGCCEVLRMFPGPYKVCGGPAVSILPITGAWQLGRLEMTVGAQMSPTRAQ